MKQLTHHAISFCILLLATSVSAEENQNQWRSLFKDVPTITQTQLDNDTNSFVLVDVRHKFNYDERHAPGALHVSFTSRMFMLQMENLSEKNRDKTIVVYCDTENCIKSYRAVAKCQQADLKNVVLFDINKEIAQDKMSSDATFSALDSKRF